MTQLQFGSLDDKLKQYGSGNALLMKSAGPVSDAFIMSRGPRDLLSGPVGSGKTTACIKRALRSAIEQPPMLVNGQRKPRAPRLYSLVVFRQTYAQLWGSTIKSWLKVLDPNKGVGQMVGSQPRPGLYTLDFEDGWGPIQLKATFLAWGDDADPDDLGGTEYTDAYLNEMNTLREDLFTNIARSVGRYPNRAEIGLPDDPSIPYGRIFGDSNAPAPDNWTFRDFWGPEKPAGFRHFKQPSGFAPDAENLGTVGRSYYQTQREANSKKLWWIKIKLEHKPGYNRETDIIYSDYDDDVHVSHTPIPVYPILPVLVGFDGGYTPAAAFEQELGDGHLNILAEVALGRGDEFDLAERVKVIMGSPRFKDCDFHFVCDPAMDAGSDTKLGSMRSRLAAELGLKTTDIKLASSNDPEARHSPIRSKIFQGRRKLTVDATHCPTIRRALAGTYQYRTTHGTGDRSGAIKNPDSHVMEAAEYAAMACGTEAAKVRRDTRAREREERRTGKGGKPKPAPRFNPITRSYT